MEAIILHLASGLLLVVLAYSSLRFTTLDPQMPIPSSRWTNLAAAVGSVVALFATRLALPTTWTQFCAYLALTLVISPAIVPRYKLTREEDPDWMRRVWRSQVGSKAGAVVATVLKLGAGFIAALLISIIPSLEVSLWLLTIAAAAGFSILTRPFSFRLSSGTILPIDHASIELSQRILQQRLIALLSTILWLAIIGPLLDGYFSETFNVVIFALAIVLTLLLT
jgi:hypothetical protein